VTPREEARPHGLAVPPGEDLQKKIFHGAFRRFDT
jgi:hypothetical protein